MLGSNGVDTAEKWFLDAKSSLKVMRPIAYNYLLFTPYYPVKWRYKLGMRTKARRLLLRNFLMDKADAVIAVSGGIKNSIQQTYPDVSIPVHCLYNPLDIKYIQSRMVEECSHPWFDEDIPVIVSVCRLDPEKDLPTMLDAFSIAVKKRPLRLILVGAGVLENKLKEITSYLGINDSVCFTGYVENQYPYMHKADVFAMSSYAEGLGCSLQEALICGATIVTTDYDYGASELLENGKYGTLVSIKDPQAMADAFLYSVDNKRNPVSLVEKAQEFDVDTHTDNLLSIVGE